VPEGDRVLDLFLDPVAQYLAKAAPKPPGKLAVALDKLDPHTLALAALTPLLDASERGWGDADDPSSIAKLRLQIGEHLRDRLTLANALVSESAADRLIGETVVANPDSHKGRRFRGKLRRMLQSDDPAERAAAERVAAMPPRRGRPRQSDYLDLLKADWNQEEMLQAGGWLADAILMGLDLFVFDKDRLPVLNPKFQPIIDDLREQLLWRDPVLMPHTDGPPPDWTAWRKQYDGRLSKTLVKDWRPETRAEIEAALAATTTVYSDDEEQLDLAARVASEWLHSGESVAVGEAGIAELQAYVQPVDRITVPITVPSPFKAQHVAAMNTLKNVPLRLDPAMVDLVKEFGARTKADQFEGLIKSSDKVDRAIGHKLKRQHKRDLTAVSREMADAKWLNKQNGPFHLDYKLDRRGRFYANQHLHFGREDHIRALFRFERGKPLDVNDTLHYGRVGPYPKFGMSNSTGIEWLEIHAANTWGLDKKPWPDRIEWARNPDNKKQIRRVADNPDQAIIQWRNAEDKPDKAFLHIAACRELVRAWDNPGGFETHLPVSFDGSANGLQHLALMMRDPQAAELTNLIPTTVPIDVYTKIIECVLNLLQVARGEHALWWRDKLADLNPKTRRKLIKTPALAFAYNISNVGMANDIRAVFQEEVSRKQRDQPLNIDGRRGDIYLAQLVRKACEEVLPGPARALKYIKDVTAHCLQRGRFVRLIGPTGMPFVNRYHLPNMKTVRLVGSEHDIADGATGEINKSKTRDSAAANIVHMMDAAHLARVINAAAAEPDPIEVLTVHDSYSCLAPHAQRLNEIIRVQLALMYSTYDPLAELRRLNVEGDILPLPDRGDDQAFRDLLVGLQAAEYCFA
jgi:DNA-dependent RNA polymerase